MHNEEMSKSRAKETSIKSPEGCSWSENDFSDLLEKSDAPSDETTTLDERDFASKMESPEEASLSKSDIGSIKEEGEPIEVVYESGGTTDYDDVY